MTSARHAPNGAAAVGQGRGRSKHSRHAYSALFTRPAHTLAVTPKGLMPSDEPGENAKTILSVPCTFLASGRLNTSLPTAGAEKHTSYQKRSGLPHILSSSSSSSSTGKLKKDNSRLCPTALAFHVHCSSPATANVCYVSKGNGLDLRSTRNKRPTKLARETRPPPASSNSVRLVPLPAPLRIVFLF